MNGNSSIQKDEIPKFKPKSQSILYVQKSLFDGPNNIIPKTISLLKKAITEKNNIEAKDLIMCHLSSSRWSIKDISFSCFIYLCRGNPDAQLFISDLTDSISFSSLITLSMKFTILIISDSNIPLVVIAADPTLIPDVTKGDSVS